MSRILDRLSWLITVRPYITIIVLIIVTVVLGAGSMFRAPPTEGADVAFLPPGHAIANATQEIDEHFGDSGEDSVVTLLFRGEALTPGGLSQIDALIDEIVREPGVGELLAPSNAVATILVKTELTESRTLLNLHNLTAAFDDELRRPKPAVGPIHESYEALVHDWTDDSGELGDKHDPELATLFRDASPGVELDPGLMQEFVDKLVAREPELARFVINDPEGIDIILILCDAAVFLLIGLSGFRPSPG